MDDLEQALEMLEAAHQELVARGLNDFESLERAMRDRAAAIDSVFALMQNTAPADDQIARLKRVQLGGLLTMARIAAARQALRQELADVSQQARVLSGYQAGSTIEP